MIHSYADLNSVPSLVLSAPAPRACPRNPRHGLSASAPWFLLQPSDHAALAPFFDRFSARVEALAEHTDLLLLRIPVAPRSTPMLGVPLGGHSALLFWSGHSLKLWFVEPDFSAPPPHLGFAFSHLLAQLAETR